MWNKRGAKVIQHPIAHELYQYHYGPRFEAGAPAEVFEPLFQLPVVSFRGRSRVAGAFPPLQPPQVWFRQQVGVVGLGGIQSGQYVGQPLIDGDMIQNTN